ncbi:proline dehydrogenase family protein [Paraflavitalea sp. CAU 1676]|uniref:proline dehydrogenase family protein n=1 Tax=Paraflavitalea sp. CAU 1676 TaxID=3032598 RepID=UPI0023DC9860|nr:proline dehydrogenase family protein [Paraflavitalea sp. CAU 1676]MDF2190133.1 proline dehydrogenase family protein [Paraflavitalea sp. CAU 1676]
MDNPHPVISFDNTEYAFAYKTDQELKKANFLFSSMGYESLVKLGTRFTPWAIKAGLPIKGLIRNTIFKQFVGGETLEETARVANKLEQFKVQVILDYGVEGKEGEENFDHATDEFIRVINFAATQPNIPFMSIKVTGFARFALLEKLDAAANGKSGYEGRVHTEVLTEEEKAEWQRVVGRMHRIIKAASSNKVGVLVDAEETWIQDPVDALTMQMMELYNIDTAVVFNTIQLYRHDRLAFLHDSFRQAEAKRFILGAKLVRGAYMEKERRRAEELNYASPIQPSKEASDTDYNKGVEFCIEHLDRISLIVASHNEHSSLRAVELLDKKGLPHNHPHIHFSQLYGMSDNITFNLAKSGLSVSKYLPFGPIHDVVPYLMRRAQENSSVSGQTGRELGLIRKEMKRRKL